MRIAHSTSGFILYGPSDASWLCEKGSLSVISHPNPSSSWVMQLPRQTMYFLGSFLEFKRQLY